MTVRLTIRLNVPKEIHQAWEQLGSEERKIIRQYIKGELIKLLGRDPEKYSVIHRLIHLCKKEGRCSEGTIALWLNKMGWVPYFFFKQLKKMCAEGLLDDDAVKCLPKKDSIIFIARDRKTAL